MPGRADSVRAVVVNQPAFVGRRRRARSDAPYPSLIYRVSLGNGINRFK